MSLIRSSSAWDQAGIDAFIQRTIVPVRLACADSAGVPLICSLWYLYDDQAIWCATQQSAAITQYLQQQKQCGFEIAPETMPYRGVRGQGAVTLDPEAGEAVLRKLIARYLDDSDGGLARWLLERADTEVAIRIQPEWLTSWDFSPRMQSKS